MTNQPKPRRDMTATSIYPQGRPTNDELIARAEDGPIDRALVVALIAALKASEARGKELEDTMRFINDKGSWEINPSNYDHQDVCHLNADWIEVGNAAQEALKGGTQ